MLESRNVGRYEILEQIGRGGMAVVYLARQLDLDRLVALKELSAFHASDAAWASRFLRESRLAGSLTHPNIVTVYDYLEWEGTPFIAMEYLERGSLRPYVGTLTLAQVGGVLADTLSALAYAHRRSIVHRDLKPENLMVTGEGQVSIADFGIAKATSQVSSGAFQTDTGMTVGTPGYMAPEQAMATSLGPWTDLYSVGCMAYEFVVGQVPFGDSVEPLAMILRHINEPIASAKSLVAGLEPAISDWIEGLLIKAPEDRTQSATDAWQHLDEILFEVLGPRWRRESSLPAIAADARTTTASSLPRPTSILHSQEIAAAARSASAPADLLTPPPAGAIGGPYTPPPAGLDFSDPRGGNDPPVSESASPPASGLDRSPERVDDGFVTFEPPRALPRVSEKLPGFGDVLNSGPPTLDAPQPHPASQHEEHRLPGGAGSSSDATITARPRPPDAVLARRATLSSPHRPRRVQWAVVTGVVAVAVVVALVVVLVGNESTTSPSRKGAAVQGPLPLRSGPISVELPAGSSRDTMARTVPGLGSQTPVSAQTRDGTRVMLGLTDAGSVTPTLLPRALAPSAPGRAVSLGVVDAYRYDRLEVPGLDRPVSLFAIPTDAGVATVACVATKAAATDVCSEVAHTLKLSTGVFALGPSAAYGHAIDGIVNRVNDRVNAQVHRMDASTPADGRASAAGTANQAFASAAKRTRNVRVSPADRQAHDALVNGLRDAASAYKQLASAARHSSRQRDRDARAQVAAAERNVNAALALLTSSGYDDLITTRLRRQPIPSLPRRRPAPTPTRTATPPPSQPTATPSASPRPPAAPTFVPTAKPTPIHEKPTPIPVVPGGGGD